MVKPTAGYAAGREPLRAPRGATISCKGWQQEAALRMLMNSLDTEVAETPEDTVLRDDAGEKARDSKPFDAIFEALARLENDETLLIESGEPAGVFRTHREAPRILIAGSATGNWTYPGAQAYLHWAYQALAAAAQKCFRGSLGGKLIVSVGMGALGGAQALGATLHCAAFLGIDADAERIKRRVKSGYCDVMVNDLDEALRILKNAVRKREAASVGLAGDRADVIAELASRGVVPDILSEEKCTDVLALERMGAVKLEFEGGQNAALLWAALSGESADIHRADDLLLEMFPQDENLCRWIQLSRKRVRFQGLPMRVCRLDRGGRARFALALNELAARGELRAPMAITRLYLDGGSSGPSLSLKRQSRNGLDVIADGTTEMSARVERVLSSDAGMGIVAYAGATDPEAAGLASESGMNIPTS